MCESLILVDTDANISAEALHSELLRFYADDTQAPSEINLSSQTISLRWPDYQLQVAREQLPHVLEESAEIAERFAGDHPDRERIGSCRCRFATAGDDDPDMLHFNDYLFVGEAAERLDKVYRFDQSSCEFM